MCGSRAIHGSLFHFMDHLNIVDAREWDCDGQGAHHWQVELEIAFSDSLLWDLPPATETEM